MDDWWAEIDGAILEALAGHGPMTPADVAKHAGISEGEATAFLAMLAREGRVRMCLVGPLHSAERGTSGRW
jgi:DNA-binding Lrp family transcriptional regulator